MKKIIFVLMFSVVFALPVRAADYSTEIENIAEEYNIDRELIENVSLESVADYIKEIISDIKEKPLALTASITGIIILCAVVRAVWPAGIKDEMCEKVGTLIIFITLLTPLQQIVTGLTDDLLSVKNFMLSFLPVFAGISMASGEVVTASVYTGLFLSGLVFAADLCVDVVMPTLSFYFALIAANAISPYIKLKSIGDFYLKSVRWTMRTIVSVICFLLTVQTVVSGGGDTLAVKTGKVLAGSAIPVIGSVLQDAVGSVFAAMESIKGFAGAVGMAGVAVIFLPSLVMLAIYRVCLNAVYVCCDIFEMKTAGACIKGFMDITELLISVVFLFSIMLIFSLTIMISMTNGV